MKVAGLILAAGKGTRFKSNIPKPCHEILFKPMIFYPLYALSKNLPLENIFIVTGYKAEILKKKVLENFNNFPEKNFIYQENQLGTGHALKVSLSKLHNYDYILVLNGDMPLIDENTIRKILTYTQKKIDLGFVTVKLPNPKGYGRVLKTEKGFEIIEEKDIKDENIRKINLVNAGIYLIKLEFLLKEISNLSNKNVQKEYYITDLISIFSNKGYKIEEIFIEDPNILKGVNNRKELEEAQELLREKINRYYQLEVGVTIYNEKEVYISIDSQIGQDSIIYGPAYIIESKLGENVKVFPYTFIEKSTIEDNVTLGPFARIRPNSYLEKNSKVGNFVEVKNAYLAKGVKANHLSYLGDIYIGEDTNIGAGTIVCNYDGVKKYKSFIGKNSFIGSNSTLISPVVLEDNTLVAAGSVVGKNSKKNDLVISRSPQKNIENGYELHFKKSKDILSKIISKKKKEIEELKNTLPLEFLVNKTKTIFPKNPFDYLKSDRPNIIAEIKFASPSKGLFFYDLLRGEDKKELALYYLKQYEEKLDPFAISVITDKTFFLGDYEILKVISENTSKPTLFKDFVIDIYQIYLAKYLGASLVLLIYKVLKENTLDFTLLAIKEGLTPLVEVSTKEELEIVLETFPKNIPMFLGFNCRDLKSFKTDINVYYDIKEMIKKIPFVFVAESGIKSYEDIRNLQKLGINVFLIGEALVTGKFFKSKEEFS